MPRMNIRPIYDDDELTGGEHLSRGVAGAIDVLLQNEERKRADAEADRQETNQFSAQGFTPVRRGEEMLSGPPRMKRTIGSAIGFELEQPAPGAGMDQVRTRSGVTMRRPGAEMRAAAGEARELDTYRKKEEIRVGAERQLIPLRNQRTRSGMTQQERVELEGIRQQGRMAIQAMISGRGNASMQLQAAKAVQASLDGRVRAAQARLIAAQRAYDNDAAADAADALEAAQQAADSYRDELASIEGGGPAGPRAPAHAPDDPRAAAARRQRPRQAPRTAPVTPPPANPTGRRTVPPPVRRP